jgi:hypothetical protein
MKKIFLPIRIFDDHGRKIFENSLFCLMICDVFVSTIMLMETVSCMAGMDDMDGMDMGETAAADWISPFLQMKLTYAAMLVVGMLALSIGIRTGRTGCAIRILTHLSGMVVLMLLGALLVAPVLGLSSMVAMWLTMACGMALSYAIMVGRQCRS